MALIFSVKVTVDYFHECLENDPGKPKVNITSHRVHYVFRENIKKKAFVTCFLRDKWAT